MLHERGDCPGGFLADEPGYGKASLLSALFITTTS